MSMESSIPVASEPEAAIRRFAELTRTGAVDEPRGEPRLGIDLGTANIVASVVDQLDRPVTGAWLHSTVVRSLAAEVEHRLGFRFTRASLSIPPGISQGDIQVFRNVAEAADLDVECVVDEPVAAARALGITDGCVIDIGHGTTGVSILAGGEVVRSMDEATGGHHMTLVVAGRRKIDYDAAEAVKKDAAEYDGVLSLIRPTLQKMASIAASVLGGQDVPVVYLVGGSSSFPHAAEVFTAWLDLPVIRPAEPLFVTPLGIPMRGPAGTRQRAG